MSKISIEEALKTKLPLPWKVTDPTGTSFLVARRRPEDLTAGKPAGSVNKKKPDASSESALKTTPPAELPKIPVEPPFRMHDICKSIGFIPMSEFASGQSVDMDRTIDPAEDADGLNYQDRHNLGIKEAGVVPEVDSPISFTSADPPIQTRIEIICNGASVQDLEDIHSRLFSFSEKKSVFVNGTLRIVI